MVFFEDSIPEEFAKYKLKEISFPYNKKDYFKQIYKSLCWNSEDKTWLCTLEDYKKIRKDDSYSD